jgi:hypothetical protein
VQARKTPAQARDNLSAGAIDKSSIFVLYPDFVSPNGKTSKKRNMNKRKNTDGSVIFIVGNWPKTWISDQSDSALVSSSGSTQPAPQSMHSGSGSTFTVRTRPPSAS